MSGWVRVVVGVDGSAESQKALRWAYDEARSHDAELLVIGARMLPSSYPPPFGGFEWTTEIADGRQTKEMLDAAVASVIDDDAAHVRTQVAEGTPATALIDAAEGADLLVVGSRGHGAFAGMLLGSVSLHVTTHAPCPVTVVR
jgi:nucleotide-binding universal stress UspA family protein